MGTWLGIPIIIIIIIIFLALILHLAPLIIIFQLNDIKRLLRKINKNLSTHTAERNSSEAENNYSTNKHRSTDLLKSLFSDEKDTSDQWSGVSHFVYRRLRALYVWARRCPSEFILPTSSCFARANPCILFYLSF